MDDQELLAVAEALQIPWRRLVEGEIHAERELRRCLGDADPETPFWRILAALQMSVLDSWRARERVAALAWEARASGKDASVRGASRGLKTLCDHLSGKRAREGGEDLLVRHLEFAYRRVLELQDAARAGEKSRGVFAARVRQVVLETGCLEADAKWAVDRALAPRGRPIIEDAVAKARSEGFEIPRGETEFRSWMLLRQLVRGIAAERPRRPRRPRPAPAAVAAVAAMAAVANAPRPRAAAPSAPAWTSLKAEERFPMALASGAR